MAGGDFFGVDMGAAEAVTAAEAAAAAVAGDGGGRPAETFLTVQLFPLPDGGVAAAARRSPPPPPPPPPPLLLLFSPASSESLSEMSEPPLSLSRISDEANLRDARGDAGGGRRLHT